MVFYTIITFNRARKTRAFHRGMKRLVVIRTRPMQFNANKIFCHVQSPPFSSTGCFSKNPSRPDLVKQIGSAILRFLSGRNCASSNELSDVKKQITGLLRWMMSAGSTLVQVHSLIRRDGAAIAIVIEVDKLRHFPEPRRQKLNYDPNSCGGENPVRPHNLRTGARRSIPVSFGGQALIRYESGASEARPSWHREDHLPCD